MISCSIRTVGKRPCTVADNGDSNAADEILGDTRGQMDWPRVRRNGFLQVHQQRLALANSQVEQVDLVLFELTLEGGLVEEDAAEALGGLKLNFVIRVADARSVGQCD